MASCVDVSACVCVCVSRKNALALIVVYEVADVVYKAAGAWLISFNITTVCHLIFSFAGIAATSYTNQNTLLSNFSRWGRNGEYPARKKERKQ